MTSEKRRLDGKHVGELVSWFAASQPPTAQRGGRGAQVVNGLAHRGHHKGTEVQQPQPRAGHRPLQNNVAQAGATTISCATTTESCERKFVKCSEVRESCETHS